MHISWLGNTAIKIQTKPFDQDVVVIIDPYRQDKGAFPRNLAPDIGLYTRGEKNSITLSDDAFILSSAGEIEKKGVLITAVTGHNQDEVMFRIDAEQLSVGHLGLTNKVPNDKQMEALSEVDILILPVGHKDGYDEETAAKVVNAIEPRIVIPMAFQSDNDPQAKPINSFLKEMGAVSEPAEKKVIIKKKDLPQEEMKIVVLSKE